MGQFGNNPQGNRRKHRDRYAANEDVFGEADAEDRFDDGSSNDMYMGQHAAGLDYDPTYEQSYSQRQGAEYQQPYTPGVDLGGSDRAQQFRERFQRQPRGYERRQMTIDATPNSSSLGRMGNWGLETLSCSSPILLLLLGSIGLFVCMIMAYLAFQSLTRHLGL